MRQLLLLRHAKSSWDDPMLSDHARPLNPRGQDAARVMAQAFRTLGLAPDVVLVSSARRTLQTLAAFEPWDESPLIEVTDALYLAPAPEILAVIRRVAPASRSVMVIGHNPGMHELAVQMASLHAPRGDAKMQRMAEGYPTGALAEFSVTTPWPELGPAGTRLTRFLVPKDLTHTDTEVRT